MRRIVGVVTLFTLVGLVFAGCGAASNSSQSSWVTTQERDFLVQWIPDLHMYQSLLRQIQYESGPTAIETYDSLHGLSQKWDSYAAPSARTEALLSQWLEDVQTVKDVAKLIAEGNVEAAKPIFGSFTARAAERQEFVETLGNLAVELGAGDLLGGLGTTSTMQSTTTGQTIRFAPEEGPPTTR